MLVTIETFWKCKRRSQNNDGNNNDDGDDDNNNDNDDGNNGTGTRLRNLRIAFFVIGFFSSFVKILRSSGIVIDDHAKISTFSDAPILRTPTPKYNSITGGGLTNTTDKTTNTTSNTINTIAKNNYSKNNISITSIEGQELQQKHQQKQQKQQEQKHESLGTNVSFFSPSTFIYNRSAVVDFERQEGVVIVTKIHGPHQESLLLQSLCLLQKAYNDRVNYDIVVFTTEPLPTETLEDINTLIGSAKVTIALDNRGSLQKEIEALPPHRYNNIMTRCNVTDYNNLTWFSDCPQRLAYNWQAEFRSWHIWVHPALSKYRYMLWMDSDGFATKTWERDPIAHMIRNDLVIFFDNFPKGRASGHLTQQKILKSFNKTLCHVQITEEGRLHAKVKDGNGCGRQKFPVIHGFFHITDLEFYRSEPVIRFAENWIGDCFCCREYDDQAAVTIPAAMLAPERSWDMRSHGFRLDVFHNGALDGKESVGGFKKYNKDNKHIVAGHGVCPVKNGM